MDPLPTAHDPDLIAVEPASVVATAVSNRCGAIDASSHRLNGETVKLASRRLTSAASCSDWRALTDARIADTWATAQPESLVWLSDKFEQVERTRVLLDSDEQLHVPVLVHLDADAPELPFRTRVWHNVDALVQSLLDREFRGLVVKPRHGHDAIGVTVWTWATLQDAPEEATDRVWQSVEQAMACYDDSWQFQCWQLSQVPRGAVVQPLYACELVAGRDCDWLNTTSCEILDSSAAPGAGTAALPTISIPQRVRSNQDKYPIELRVHVLFGSVVGATLRSHADQMWVDETGKLFIFSDPPALAHGSGERCQQTLLLTQTNGPYPWAAEEAESSGESEATGVGELAPLVQRLATLLHGPDDLFHARIVPDSELLCAAVGLDELRVDWLLGDVSLGPRLLELTYMGSAFSGVPSLSQAAAQGYLQCALRHPQLVEACECCSPGHPSGAGRTAHLEGDAAHHLAHAAQVRNDWLRRALEEAEETDKASGVWDTESLRAHPTTFRGDAGDMALITGLTARKSLNGMVGSLLQWIPGKERWAVAVGTETVLICPINLRQV